MQLPFVALPGVVEESRRLSWFFLVGVSTLTGSLFVIYWFYVGDWNTDCLLLISWAKIWCLLAIAFLSLLGSNVLPPDASWMNLEWEEVGVKQEASREFMSKKLRIFP